MSDTAEQTYNVTGMSCEHCVAAVGEQVGGLAGVDRVDVDLASGTLVVQGSAIDGEAVLAAVQAAGYDLAVHA
jgi:copper chaperone CopZ